MSKTLLENISEKKAEWLLAREAGITASQIAAIAGLNPYQSPLETWALKTGKVEPENIDNKPAVVFGRVNEPLVRKRTGEILGVDIYAPDALFGHDEIEWAMATPDSFIGDGSILAEHKTTGARNAHRWEDGDAPIEYQIQVQWQLGVCGMDGGVLSAMIGGDAENIAICEIEFEEDVFGELVEMGENFIDCCKQDIPPSPGPKDAKLISSLFKKKGKATHFVGKTAENVEYWGAEIRALKADKKEHDSFSRKLGSEIKLLENRIVLAMGDASTGVLPDGREVNVKTISVAERMQSGYSYSKVKLWR